MKGRNACLCSTKSALLFFDLRRLQSAKVCLYSRQNSLCCLITHLICGAPDKQTAVQGLRALLGGGLTNWIFAVIDAESTAETKDKTGEERRGAGRKKEGKVGWDDEEVRGRGETFGKTQKGN